MYSGNVAINSRISRDNFFVMKSRRIVEQRCVDSIVWNVDLITMLSYYVYESKALVENEDIIYNNLFIYNKHVIFLYFD